MTKRLQRIISLLVCTLLIVSSMPIGVLAGVVSNAPVTQVENTVGVGDGNLNEAALESVVETPVAPEADAEEPSLANQQSDLNLSTAENISVAESIQSMTTDVTGTYEYTLDANNQATITDLVAAPSATTLTIPAILDTYLVVKIGAGVFKDNTKCATIEKIIIPSSIAAIESDTANRTFSGCSSLTSVEIPASVTKIGAFAFEFPGRNSAFKMIVEPGSLAEKYAQEYNIKSEPVTFYIKSFEATLPSGQNIKTNINLTAVATGGTGTLSYRFYGILGTEEVPIKDWSNTSTVTFTPVEAGIYTIYVEVKDSTTTVTKTINGYKVINTPKISSFISDLKSPQYPDASASIKFTAGVEGGTGTGDFEYQFSYQQVGSSEVIAQPYSSSNTWTVNKTLPTSTYTFYVTVKDEEGLTAKESISDYRIVADLGVGELLVDKASPQELGTALKLTAQGFGGKFADYQYRFSYELDSNGIEAVIQEYSANSSVTFTPPSQGVYKLKVIVTNASGKEVEDTMSFTINQTPKMGEINVNDNKPYYYGDVGTMTLSIDGIDTAGAYDCKFWSQLGTSTKEPIKTVTNQSKSTTTQTATFAPPKAGSYTFYVDVTDPVTKVTTTKVSTVFVVYDPLGGTLTPDKKSPQNKNTTVKLTAKGSGGKAPYTYEFSCSPDTGFDFENPSTTNTVSIPLSGPDSYDMKVTITDANGREKTVDPLVYEIRDNPVITNFIIDREGEPYNYLGDVFDLEAKVESDKATLLYQFSCKQGSKTVWTSTWSAVATASYKPVAAGTYTFTVSVKDGDNLTATKTSDSFKVLAEVTGKAVKVSKTTGVVVNNTVKLTAAGAGGQTAYQYNFFFKKGTDSIKPVNNDPSQKTIDYQFEDVGSYTFYVEITDANDQNNKYLETASIPVKVTNPPIVETFIAIKDPIEGETGTPVLYANDTINLAATVKTDTGEGTLKYQFAAKMGSQTVWESTDPTKSSAGFVPLKAGTYTLIVTVTDGEKSIGTKTITNVKVLPGGTAKPVKVSKTTGVIVGDKIKLTATAVGGKSPYQYKFWFDDGSGFEEIGVTEENAIDYTIPDKTGTYTFGVDIFDANNVKVCDHNDSVSATVVVTNPPVINGLTVEKTLGHVATKFAYQGDTVELTALKETGTGEGTDLNYKFEAKIGSKIIASKEGTADQVTMKLDTPGTYTFTVTITDAEKSKDTYSVSSYKVYPEVLVKSLKANKTTDVVVDDEVKLTATGVGGKTAYKYQFYVNSIAVGSNSESNTYTYTPSAAGTYTVTVKITDANNVESNNPSPVTLVIPVGNPPVINDLSATPEFPPASYEGEKITLEAVVDANSGVGGKTYSFYYTQGTKKSTPITVTVPTTTIVAPAAGTYNLCVDVSDGISKVTKKISSYKILPKVAVKSIKADKTADININTPVKITATASGGKTPYTYEFYSIDGNGLKDIFKDYTSSNTAEFVPTLEGGYTIHVNIKDANGRKCENSPVYITDLETVNNPSINALSTSIDSKMAYVEDQITVSSDVVGGKKPYTYKYYAQLGSSAKVSLTADTTDPTKAVFKPTAAGTYKLTLEIVDAENRKANKEIKTYVVLAKPSITSLTVAKDTVVKGNAVLVKAVATGGQKPYSYKFYYKIDSGTEEEIVRDKETVGSYNFFPAEAGKTYTMYVEVIDKNGQKVKKEANKTIKVTEATTTP